MHYDLSKYEKAFGLLGPNYQSQIPSLVRQAMIFVALNTAFDTNDNKGGIQNLFGNNSGFERDDQNVLNCLKEIKRLG
jgi:hypothetical protein